MIDLFPHWGHTGNTETSSESSKPKVDNPVKENDTPADDSYFDDVVFVGDSLTYGISSYNILTKGVVLAQSGITVDGALTNKVVTFPGGAKSSLVDAVSHYNPGKIYVMLGTNGFAFISQDEFIKSYEKMLDKLIADNPDAIIYAQSILPVSNFLTAQDSRYSNKTIDRFNAAIMELCTEKGVHFLNVAEVYKQGDGSMNAKYSADGTHISQSAYQYWMDYIKNHVAK